MPHPSFSNVALDLREILSTRLPVRDMGPGGSHVAINVMPPHLLPGTSAKSHEEKDSLVESARQIVIVVDQRGHTADRRRRGL